jgi:hypothetical protein
MGGRLDLCGGTVTRGNIVATCLDLSVYSLVYEIFSGGTLGIRM